MYKNTDNEMRIRMRKIHKKSFKIKEIIEEHLRENLKYYMIVSIIMLIGTMKTNIKAKKRGGRVAKVKYDKIIKINIKMGSMILLSMNIFY